MIIDDDALDPEIRSLMEALAPYPARDPVDEAHGLENFLAAAKLVRDSSSPTIPRRKRISAPPQRQIMPVLSARPGRRGLKALAASLILLIIILFGASLVTTKAARASLPGDTLYPVKTALEKVRITMNTNAAQNAELHLLFAQHRLDEISLLVVENRPENLKSTAELFRYHLLEAMKAAQIIAENDPTRAQAIALAVNDLATDAVVILSNLRTMAPEATGPAIDQALLMIHLNPEKKASGDLPAMTIPSVTSTPLEETLPHATITATIEAFSTATVTPAAENTSLPDTPPTIKAPSTPTEAPANAFDIDIQNFKVSALAKVGAGNLVKIQLHIKNNGLVEGQGIATLTGVQNGVEVYNQTLPVTGATGSAFRRYSFPDFVPTASGEIIWKISLRDDDPDVDEQVSYTRVEAEDNPGGGQTGILDLDIQNIKITASLRLSKGRLIEIEMGIKNNGLAEGQGSVTISGVQNGIEVYNQTLTVTDAVGGRFSRYVLPSYASSASGEIVWTITLSDGDPDADTVTATTQVEP